MSTIRKLTRGLNKKYIINSILSPIVMIGLLIYSLRDVRFASMGQWVPQISAIIFTIVTYLWKKNSLVSIFGGTIIYMILIRVPF